VFTVDDDKITHIQDCPDRERALNRLLYFVRGSASGVFGNRGAPRSVA